ncbi:MAG TPA: hypothetical protein VGB17_18845 [Pyrinomonadaceae bacterium]|jgi:hypothetical protein
MSSLEIKSWQVFPSEGGEALAFDGERMAVGGQARLSVWEGQRRLASMDAPTPAPGRPRFAGERVCWGPGIFDLASGSYTLVQEALPRVQPGRGERPHVYAWSPRGERLLGSFSTGDSLCPVRVRMFGVQSGNAAATLWEGSGLPPSAAWLGESAAVIGFGDPKVFDDEGKHLADIPLGGGTIASIEATHDEHRLIIVDLNRSLALIETESWTVLDSWSGPWLHGAVSSDGRFVAVLEHWGKLHFACLEGDRFKPVGEAAADSRAVALALATGEIATVGGGEVRRAGLKVDCATTATP